MLAAPPVYYDPDQAVPVPDAGDYQQWIAANYPGQYPSYTGGTGIEGSAMGQMAYQQPPQPHPQQQQQGMSGQVNVTTPPAQQMQNQYHFVQQYVPQATSSQGNPFGDFNSCLIKTRVSICMSQTSINASKHLCAIALVARSPAHYLYIALNYISHIVALDT